MMKKFKFGVPTFVIAAACGSMAMMSPNWQADLMAASGAGYSSDLDGSGTDDVLLRSTSTGVYRLFKTAGGAVSGNNGVSVWNAGWTFQALADVDGDGDNDINVRDDAAGTYKTSTFRTVPLLVTVLLNCGRVVGISLALVTLMVTAMKTS